MAVFRQVKFAGAAWNGAAMFNRAQKLTILQRLQEIGAGMVEFIATCGQVRDQGCQPLRIDFRLALEAMISSKLEVVARVAKSASNSL